MWDNMKQTLQKYYYLLLGAVAGLLNGLFGSGGGVAVVPMLEKADIPPKKAHATSIAIILPLSIVSVGFYLYRQNFQIMDALPYVPGGLAGAVVGSLLLKKIPNDLLRRIFGALIIVSSARILFFK